MSEATRQNFAPEGSGSTGFSRRQVVKAGIWAAPAVVVAIAAPGAAATGPTATLNGTPTSVASGTSRVVTANVTLAGFTGTPSAILNWRRVAPNGNVQTGSVAGTLTPTTAGFSFSLPANSGTMTATISFYDGSTLVNTTDVFPI